MCQEPISVADRGRHPPGGVMSEAMIVDAVRTPTEPAVKWIYDFAEGSRDMRELLGGKGSGIAEMTRPRTRSRASRVDHYHRGVRGIHAGGPKPAGRPGRSCLGGADAPGGA